MDWTISLTPASIGYRIADVEEVPEDSTFLFRLRDRETDEEQEAILVRVDGEVSGWLNCCQHFRHVELDKGSGVEMRGDEIVCIDHGAMFEADTGYCTFGPCEGAYLDSVEVTVRDSEIYLTDQDYEFVGVGPIEKDPLDLSSTSNIEF
jgi:nitrite reductase/ring-hydroxylating ferredoxin subunit